MIRNLNPIKLLSPDSQDGGIALDLEKYENFFLSLVISVNLRAKDPVGVGSQFLEMMANRSAYLDPCYELWLARSLKYLIMISKTENCLDLEMARDTRD